MGILAMAIFKIAYSVTFIGSTQSLFKQHSLSHSPRDKTVRDFCFREADSAEEAKQRWIQQHPNSDNRIYDVLYVVAQ